MLLRPMLGTELSYGATGRCGQVWARCVGQLAAGYSSAPYPPTLLLRAVRYWRCASWYVLAN
eukprot:2975392-Rhodomonas_salina.1